MNKQKVQILVLLLLNLSLIVFIKPIIAPFFGMSTKLQTLYFIGVYGFPLMLILPVALLMLPFAAWWSKVGGFKARFSKFTLRTYLVLLVILLSLNLLMVFTKTVLHHEPFPLTLYAAIDGTNSNCSDLKLGKYTSKFRYITRFENSQMEVTKNYKDTFLYSISWLEPNEYRLVQQNAADDGMNDTLDIKITNNSASYYDCYVRFGPYAQYQRITKVHF